MNKDDMMNRAEIDAIFNQAILESDAEGVIYTRYHFAKLIRKAMRKELLIALIRKQLETVESGSYDCRAGCLCGIQLCIDELIK